MKGKYRIIYLFASFVIEIACVFGMFTVRQTHGLGSTFFNSEVIADYRFVLNLEHTSERIYSPRYPYEDYPNNTEIIYDIKMNISDEVKQMSSRILLKFETFMLEESDSCTKDGLEIVDSTGTVGVYCGFQLERVILSEGSKVQIRFFSNPTVQSLGFRILVQIYNTECSQTFKGVSTGTFETPNFPNQYYADDICVWKIEVPEEKRILVRFNEIFDIWAQDSLCAQDYLAVSLTGNFSTNNTRYCQSERPKSMLSSENSMIFMFRTDCCYEGKGFSASFVVTDSDGVSPNPPSDPRLKKFCGCGEENKLEGERIKGGKTVDPPNRYPFVVGLVANNITYFCGGTLISRIYVLTAAHCLLRNFTFVWNVGVVLGAHDVFSGQDPVPVSKFIVHPDYNKSKPAINDIGLVRLRNPVHLTKTVGLACLPIYPQFTTPTYLATILGWGQTDRTSTYVSKGLQELQVIILWNELCIRRIGFNIPNTIICAGGEAGKGPCGGDSGGPLLIKYDEKWFTVGVVVWKLKGDCGQEGMPAGYTRVSKYLGWIRHHTQDSPPCNVKEITPPVGHNFENCGIPNESDEGRIAGGTEADPFEFPWIARIVYNQSFVGLGSLISPKYVLTVASIFEKWYHGMQIYPEVVVVFLGRHQISVVEPKSIKFDVEAATCPKGYGTPTSYNNDLALLKLKVPATGIPDVYRPICLPLLKAWYFPGLKLKTAGWGRISTSGPFSDVLRKADMNVRSKESCVRRYPRWFTENMICAFKDGTDMCEGDNGAPLMLLQNGRYYLAGLSSWGFNDDCATPGDPRVFSAVHSNLLWIRDVTGLIVA